MTLPRGTGLLLSAGAVAPPLFVAAFLLEGATRPHYSAARDTVSALDLSTSGWQQITAFLVTGALLLLFALGLHRVPTVAGRWPPRLTALVGTGLLASGLFLPDPTRGYPAGTPPGPTATSTWHNTAHGLAALLWITALSATCFVTARQATRTRPDPARPASGPGRWIWTAWSLAAGALVLVTFLASLAGTTLTTGYLATHGGLVERIAGTTAMLWLTTYALRIRHRATRV